MYNHKDKNYHCPICFAVQGIENDDTLIRESDIVYKDDSAMAFIGSFFYGNNAGAVIIIPVQHFENIYDLPEEIGHKIFDLSKKIAVAEKNAYHCDGITTLQNNEPGGDQKAFHFHLHIFPRYDGDNFHSKISEKKTPTSEERKGYADKIKKALSELL